MRTFVFGILFLAVIAILVITKPWLSESERYYAQHLSGNEVSLSVTIQEAASEKVPTATWTIDGKPKQVSHLFFQVEGHQAGFVADDAHDETLLPAIAQARAGDKVRIRVEWMRRLDRTENGKKFYHQVTSFQPLSITEKTKGPLQ